MNSGLLHYVFIHKITKKQVIIADPGKGVVNITLEEFFDEKQAKLGDLYVSDYGKQILDVEVLLPIAYRIPIENSYVFKENIKAEKSRRA